MLRSGSFVLIAALLVAVVPATALERGTDHRQRRIFRPWPEDEFLDPAHPRADLTGASAQVDTYLIVSYDFEALDWQEWTRFDFTAQRDTFWHVDDFTGLGGGDYGRLTSLEGTKSFWCGTRPGSDQYLCSWQSAPGYGNRWDQRLESGVIGFTGYVRVSYRVRVDTEPGFDFLRFEYDHCIGAWDQVAAYSGNVDTIISHTIYPPGCGATKLRFRFTSDHVYSDEDGARNSDGAAIIDSVTIEDLGGVIDYEDFESAPVGATEGGIWGAEPAEAFGTYSGLRSGLEGKDPCGENFGTQIVFFAGSPYPSTAYPGLYDTPFCAGVTAHDPPCQEEAVVSPVIDLTKYSTGRDEIQDADIPAGELPDLAGFLLRYTEYEDNPLPNLVFFRWQVRNIENECPGEWDDYNYLYPILSSGGRYQRLACDIGRFIGSDSIQINFRIVDMCSSWYLVYGDCEEHTPAPWFDNISIQRYDRSGPQWSSRYLDLFQDNFPEAEFDLESYVRADCANDLMPCDHPIIRPGDSVVVDCYSPLGGGIAEDATGPRVYMHVRCAYIGDPASPKPPLAGPELEGSYGTYVGDDGSWTLIQGDSSRTSAGNISPDRYMFDLNDSLFTRGYMIEYYFEAFDNAGESSTHPRHARAKEEFFEFTCLPTLASDILYVDDFHGRGNRHGYVQTYFDPAFQAVLPSENQPDRYDVNNPSSLVGNGPGSRAKHNHMTTAYDFVIWDSGNLEEGTIATGEYCAKSPDCQLLVDWLQYSEHDVGLWVLGDEVAYDLSNSPSPCALELMSTICGVTLTDDSYFDLTGGRYGGGAVMPLVRTHENSYGNPLHPDSLYVWGGCPVFNAFDVLGATEGGACALRYPDYGGEQHCAAVQSEGLNAAAYSMKTMWFGFSYMYIRNAEFFDDNIVPIVRNRILDNILVWLGIPTNRDVIPRGITGGEVPPAWSLAQNYPNPFNPATAIRYSVREKGSVSLRIYNVAGQLVRILVDEVKEPGGHTALWDGRNDRGARVASGIYFYEMEAKEFRRTRKMVLLE